ncbi:MAG TPA: homocysteine S-methyltransferase family protein [Gaiellaceae bacterium]|nr:homocysteine S-methyltransferase family protein [Gaiellaceae bacterium]
MRLTDAGLETVLVFEEGIELPQFAAFPLVDTDEGRGALRRYYEPFLELARDRGVPLVLSAPTWRANADWGRLLGYEGEDLADVNRRAVAFLEALRDDVLEPAERDNVAIEGSVGPRGDAYSPTLLMDAEEAERYHAPQLRTLAGAGCAQATALTLTYPEEAIGIVRAAQAAGIPIVAGFTVETDGRLPNGDSIEDAILAVDEATDGAAELFVLNCAHPTHFADALPTGESRRRIRGLRANASRLSHAELDEAEELDSGDPADLAERYVALRRDLPELELLGGCCGTDIRHVTAICDAWLAAG